MPKAGLSAVTVRVVSINRYAGGTADPPASKITDWPERSRHTPRAAPASGAPRPDAPLDYHGNVNDSLPPCPECSSEYTYEMGALLVCPECAHEWSAADPDGAEEAAETVIKDAVGNVLADGDTVTVIKDLKIKGSSSVIKVGTKVRGIRLLDGVGDHDIDCKVDGVGPMQLKSSVVKKV